MTSKRSYREFWIYPQEDNSNKIFNAIVYNKYQRATGTIHVIEKAALTEAQAEIEKLKLQARNPTAYPTAMNYAEHLEVEIERLRSNLCKSIDDYETMIKDYKEQTQRADRLEQENKELTHECRTQNVSRTLLEIERDRLEAALKRIEKTIQARETYPDVQQFMTVDEIETIVWEALKPKGKEESGAV